MNQVANITLGQYSLVYNAFSFTIAIMGASTIFFFLRSFQIGPYYRTAITITGLVTLIACYHYFRIFSSWEAAFTVVDGVVKPTGQAFNDAYRYVDWLLTVPLLLIELILVMRLPREQTVRMAVKLGFLAALMVILGYPGEVSATASGRWFWWAAAMIPFLIIVYDLFVGLRESISSQPESARGLISTARWLTILSWSFYPIVFILPMLGLTGGGASTAVQVGYTIADIVAKALFGLFIYMIAVRKSEAEDNQQVTAGGRFVAAD
ncbi:MAG: bacteriorhodopsin-like [Janthinobacterium lividum]